MTTSVYFLPGLGADKRLFEKQLQAGLPITILEWKPPYKNESIQAYTERMAADIPQTDNLIIGGVSLGGIMAIELAKIVKPKKVIIISSVKNRSELSVFYRFFCYVPVHRLLPDFLFNNMQIIANIIRPFFGKMEKEETKIFLAMAKDAHPGFVKWAIDKIINWSNTEIPVPIVHIHGSSDFVFPYRYIKNPITINKGRHLIIWERPEEINKLLVEEFK